MTAAAMVGTAVGGSVALTAVVAAGALVRAIVRDPGKPTTPEWADGELTQLCAAEYRREPCLICGARHSVGCEAPAQAMSTRTGPRPKTRAAFEAWARRRLRAAGYPPLIGTFPTHRRLP